MALTAQGKLSHQHGVWYCQLLEHSKILKNSVINIQKKNILYNLHFRFSVETRFSYLKFRKKSDRGHITVKQKITAVVTKTFDSCMYSAFKPTDVFLKSTLKTTKKNSLLPWIVCSITHTTYTLENG